MKKRGSIELARKQCEAICGELPDDEQYGSVDIAEILSGHVEELQRMCEKLSLALRCIRDAAICARWPLNGPQAFAMNMSRAVLREWEKMRREDDV